MSRASLIGHDRPVEGATVSVVVDGARFSSAVRWSGETEMRVAVPRLRDGRRKRLNLGEHLTVSWWDLGKVRSRLYRVNDVAGGGDPQWQLVPAAPSQAGDRRTAPRAAVVVPVAVHGADGLVVGTSVDLSVSGARVVFPAERAGGIRHRVLPGRGEITRLVIVIGDQRLEVPAEVVKLTTSADGVREIRAAFTDLDERTMTTLLAAVVQVLGADPDS